MDAQDLKKVCHRINELLNSRAQKAWEKQKKHPTAKSQENHIEASKDAFAFVHLMEMIDHMTHEIHDLRMELAIIVDDDDEISSIVGQPHRRKYLN
jgi:predicted ester cyclase